MDFPGAREGAHDLAGGELGHVVLDAAEPRAEHGDEGLDEFPLDLFLGVAGESRGGRAQACEAFARGASAAVAMSGRKVARRFSPRRRALVGIGWRSRKAEAMTPVDEPDDHTVGWTGAGRLEKSLRTEMPRQRWARRR